MHRTCGTVDRVTEYDVFSRFYDAVMDDPGPRADRVVEWIQRYRPRHNLSARAGLRHGIDPCSARLGSRADRHRPIVGDAGRARAKVPRARLIEDDMKSFSLEERFDVVICVFDSLNHLLFFGDWESMFDAVHRHLADGGLFIFDVNTVGELRRLGEEPAVGR